MTPTHYNIILFKQFQYTLILKPPPSVSLSLSPYCWLRYKTGKTPMSYASQPANLALEEVKAKIEQRLKSKVASASVAAEEGAPEASEEKPQEQPGDKTGDNSDQADDKPGDSPEQDEKESEAQAPAEEAKGTPLWLWRNFKDLSLYPHLCNFVLK